MSKHDGRVINALHKLGGLLNGLRNSGVQQVELDAISGVQHFKWSDPELAEKLNQEKSIVEANTPTGFRGAINTEPTKTLPSPD